MSELPDSWAWSTIGELTAYIQRGKSPKYTEHSTLPVINQKCIRWNKLELQHLKFIHPDQFDAWDQARFISPGDILWNSTGTGTVGRAYLVAQQDCVPPKVVDSHVTIVRAVPEVEARYLFNWIKGPAVQERIVEMCDGTTNQIELSRGAIAETQVPVAPAREQSRIADELDTLLARVNACNDRFDAIPALLKRFRETVLDCGSMYLTNKPWGRIIASHRSKRHG
jgi:type I restriction enzyme, S subunit